VSSITLGGLAVSQSYSLTVNWLLNGTIVEDVLTGVSDVSGNLNLPFGAINRMGYVSLSLSLTVASGLTIVLNDNSLNVIRHMIAPELTLSALDADNIRVNTASLMLSDRTSDLISQGNAISYQAGGGEDWSSLLQLAPNTNLSIDPYGLAARSQKPFTDAYKNGRYIPLKTVSNPQEKVMLECFDGGNVATVSPIIMADQCDYLYVGFNVGLIASGGNPAAEYTMVWGVEGESESQWKQAEVPTMHPDILKEAEYIFSQQVCNFGNPGHLKKIWEWVKRNAPKVLAAVDKASMYLPAQYQPFVGAGTTGARAALDLIKSLN